LLKLVLYFKMTSTDLQKSEQTYFAEFGKKLPTTLRKKSQYFLLLAELPAEEPPIEEPTEGTDEELAPAKKKARKVKTQLIANEFLGATLYLRSKNDNVQVTPSNGALLHLVKNGSYIKTLVYYESAWWVIQ
jgi:hypothetical protein